MWNNKQLRRDARFHLSGSYSVAMLIMFGYSVSQSLILLLIGSIFGINVFDSYMKLFQYLQGGSLANQQIDDAVMLNLAYEIMRGVGIIGIFSLLLDIFVFKPINISINNWYVRNREIPYSPPVNMLFKHFSNSYPSLLKATLWKGLWLFLWGLPLFAVYAAFLTFALFDMNKNQGQAQSFFETPLGIVVLIAVAVFMVAFTVVIINRNIAYSQYEFILADNPNLSVRQALNLSKKMMLKNKWHYIGLKLSFFFWYLLAGIFPRLGYIFLSPYLRQTQAELYGALRAQAVANNYITMEELGFYKEDDVREAKNQYEAEFVETTNENLDPYSDDWNNQA